MHKIMQILVTLTLLNFREFFWELLKKKEALFDAKLHSVSKLFSWDNYTHTHTLPKTKQKTKHHPEHTQNSKETAELQQGLQNSRSANTVRVGLGLAVRFINKGKSRRVLAARRVIHKAYMPLPYRAPPKRYLAWPRNQYRNTWACTVTWFGEMEKEYATAMPIAYVFSLGEKGFICLRGGISWMFEYLLKQKLLLKTPCLKMQ